MSNFIITGFGRSGTMFLSNILNMSKEYTVGHESLSMIKYHDRSENQKDYVQQGTRYLYLSGCSENVIDNISTEFKTHENYGEVNSFFRETITRIDVDVKALIVRNPENILLSSFNSFPKDRYSILIQQINDGIQAIDRLIQSGIKIFVFEHMIKSIDYIYDIAEYVGIKDLELTQDMNVPINSSPKRITKFNDIDPIVLDGCRKNIEMFNRKYSHYWET